MEDINKRFIKRIILWLFPLLIVLVLVCGYCFKNVYYRTAIIRTFAKGSWYIDSEKDTIYTMGYYGVQKYLYKGNKQIVLLSENNEFCKNTQIARSAVIDSNYIYVITRSYLGGVAETGQKDYHNGSIIVMRKSDLHIIKTIMANIKYVEGKIINNKLVVSGILGFDIYDVTDRKSPNLVCKYRTPKRSEFQGLDTFTKDSADYVVFSRYTEGIQIWDITDRKNPKQKAFVPTNTNGCMTFDVVVDYPYLYSTLAPSNGVFKSDKDERGIIVYDLKDLSNIKSSKVIIPRTQWYSVNVGDKEPTFIEKYQNRIYVNFADKGLAEFDISNPSNPKFKGTTDVGNNGSHVQPFHIVSGGIIVSGNYWWDDLYVYELTH